MKKKTRETQTAVDGSQPSARPAGGTVAGGIRRWLRTAADRTVVVRGLAYAVVVGAILIAINHGDAILHGRIDATRWLQISLTVLVPYCVSTASSVGAILEREP